LEEGKMMLDVETFPGQVPYRSLLPQGVDNLLVPVCLSCTHVAWGTVRLEPTWMNIAESAGHAAALAIQNKVTPAQLDPDVLLRKLVTSHVMVSFFNDLDVAAKDPRIVAAQYFATKGFFSGYNARLDEPLTESVRRAWGQGLAALREGTLKTMEVVKAVHAAEAETSPPLGRTRGEALLGMWKTLSATKSKAAAAPKPPEGVPFWMQVGEAAGHAAVLAKKHQTTPGDLNADLLLRTLVAMHHHVSFLNELATLSGAAAEAAQYFSAKGFFANYNVNEDKPLQLGTAKVWAGALKDVPKNSWDGTKMAAEVAVAEAASSRPVTTTEWEMLLGSKTGGGEKGASVARGMALEAMYSRLLLDGGGRP